MSRAVLLLAAGASSRWGGDRPKALLPWRGDVLVNHLARAALAVADPVVRVLGAHAERIRVEAPAPEGVTDVFNAAWAEGMGGSIAGGLRAALVLTPELRAVLVLPCDQPLVTAEVLAAAFAAQADEVGRIVQCDYGEGVPGPPVVFGREFFAELLALSGDGGGREVVRRHPTARVLLPFSGGKWDLDLPADLKCLQSSLSF